MTFWLAHLREGNIPEVEINTDRPYVLVNSLFCAHLVNVGCLL